MSEQSPSHREHTGTIGRYQIQRTLGKGAMGVVYLAHDPMLERDVALKVMVSQIADDPALHERFAREAKAVAKMSHPNVVAVYDLGSHTDGSPYIAMELLKGHDLAKAMRSVPPLTLDRKVTVILQVLAGLAHAHQAGIVHRDIKPANVFLNQDGAVKIMDFGVARLTTASMTGTGSIIGTADYMSPEQVKGVRVDGRSDLFSVGCMLYELVVGRRPFHAENLMAIFYKITHEEPDFSQVPAGPEYAALTAILRKALAKELEDRYQTAYAFAMDLREYMKQHGDSHAAAHALEGLVDLEPPTHRPQPLTDVPRGTAPPPAAMTTVQGADPTVIHGRPTAVGVPGAEDENDATYIVGARAPARPRTAVERPRTQPRTPSPVAVPAPAPAGRSALPYVAAGVAALAVAGGFAAWKLRSDRLPPVETTLAPAPPATLAQVIPVPPPSLAVPPPPPSTFAATGKAAGVIRAAQAAFGAGSYARAVEQAQAALQQDPGNAEARRVLDSAQKGLSAEPRLRAAEAALRAGDHAAAVREAEAAQELAPWDRRVADLLGQARNAQYQAQLAAQKTAAPPPPTVAVAPPPPPPTAGHGAHVNALLGQADTALSGSNYDAAITLYDEALKLDPSNARAVQSRSAAIAARAIAQAGKGPAGKKFVSGKTVGSSPDAVGKAPAGFEDTPGVNVQKASQASALPGTIVFDVEPDSVRPGDRYKVRVSLSNEGQAPIQIRDMIVSTRINGRGVQGPVPPLVRSVAPREKALLRELPDLWKEDTSTWVMEVVVRTARGETYKNEVSWK